MILISCVKKTFSLYTLRFFPPRNLFFFNSVVGLLPRKLQNHSKFISSFWRKRNVSYLTPTSWLFSDIFPAVGVSICCWRIWFWLVGTGVRTRAKITFYINYYVIIAHVQLKRLLILYERMYIFRFTFIIFAFVFLRLYLKFSCIQSSNKANDTLLIM